MPDGWFWCDVVDTADAGPEPDWSRVPEAKRERVRASFLEGQKAKLVAQRWQLWGPQLPFYMNQPSLGITVIGPVEVPSE